MNVTDPVADMLTRIRNAMIADDDRVDVPASKLKRGIAHKLMEAGYLLDCKAIRNPRQGTLRLYLKYGADEKPVMSSLERVSKPGRRVYVGAEEIEPVKSGLGVALLSTSEGVLTGREAREKNVGGEYLCKVW